MNTATGGCGGSWLNACRSRIFPRTGPFVHGPNADTRCSLDTSRNRYSHGIANGAECPIRKSAFIQTLIASSPDRLGGQLWRKWRIREATRPGDGGYGGQLLPHNPRKQRKNPAAAGSGERFRGGKWRRERDSNACFAPPAPLHGRTSHQSGHVTLCGVRVAFTTTSCSARVRHLSPSRSRAAATIQGSSIMRAVDR